MKPRPPHVPPLSGRRLSAWYDGELPPEQMAAFREQIDEDEALHQELEDIQSCDELLSLWPEPDRCPDVRGRVLARIAGGVAHPDIGLPYPSGPTAAWMAVFWGLSGAAVGCLLWFSLYAALDRRMEIHGISERLIGSLQIADSPLRVAGLSHNWTGEMDR